MLEGILWALRTGRTWCSLAECHGSWKTASGCFYHLQHAGIWDHKLSTLQRRADAGRRLD